MKSCFDVNSWKKITKTTWSKVFICFWLWMFYIAVLCLFVSSLFRNTTNDSQTDGDYGVHCRNCAATAPAMKTDLDFIGLFFFFLFFKLITYTVTVGSLPSLKFLFIIIKVPVPGDDELSLDPLRYFS
jgi:hypothetical protein